MKAMQEIFKDAAQPPLNLKGGLSLWFVGGKRGRFRVGSAAWARMDRDRKLGKACEVVSSCYNGSALAGGKGGNSKGLEKRLLQKRCRNPQGIVCANSRPTTGIEKRGTSFRLGTSRWLPKKAR